MDGLQLHGNQFVPGVPCEAACEHCGCSGIYLGEKCICFCATDDKEKENCLSSIRKNELRAGIDNDILILTRTGGRFARDIRQVASLRARLGRGASAGWNTKRNRVFSQSKKEKHRTMVIRIMNGALPLWCVLGCLLAARSLPMVRADERTIVGEVMEPSEYGSISSEALCQSLCGECECRGRLVSENQCQCSCDFGANSAGGQQCTLKVQQLCSKMDVQCDFNEAAIAYVREPRGCHSMSCYEKHHDEGGYDGYSDGGDGYGHDEGYGHGVKQLVCCKDKHKHKEKKHKHKKHKKFHNKHMKFHVVIKGKIPEHSCHGGHEGGEHYEGYEEHGGYRAAKPDRQQMNPAHMPMEMSVWTNRHKQAKKHPFRRPVHAHQQPPHYGPPSHYGAVYPPPYPVDSRAKSAEPPSPEPRPEPMPEPMHHPQDAPPPQAPPPPPPPPPPSTPEPESPPVTPFPKHRLTPPPNLYDGAPIGPKSSSQNSNQDPPKHHSFSPPSPPVRPPMITVDPPPRRIESSRSSYEPSYSSCQFDSYDFNYYHPPPPPPPPPPSSYRSFSSSYDPSYPASHYHPHDQYETPKYYPAYD
uniref:Uncharacterized protein n=1 Tax=Anopheles christyi TaxID=43041 RepID=A0A182JV40_9DIPT